MVSGHMKSGLVLLGAAGAAASMPSGVEWAGVFPMADSSHTWSMQAVGCAYADQTMKVVLFATTDLDDHAIEHNEDAAGTLISGTCTVIESGESITTAPPSSGACYDLPSLSPSHV